MQLVLCTQGDSELLFLKQQSLVHLLPCHIVNHCRNPRVFHGSLSFGTVGAGEDWCCPSTSCWLASLRASGHTEGQSAKQQSLALLVTGACFGKPCWNTCSRIWVLCTVSRLLSRQRKMESYPVWWLWPLSHLAIHNECTLIILVWKKYDPQDEDFTHSIITQ